MEKVDETQVTNKLSKPEKIAQKIGSIIFEGWKCPKCSHHPVIIGYTCSSLSGFRTCHNCHELTVIHTEKTLKHPTRYGEGKRLLIDKCHCCGYFREKQQTIPRLPSPPPSHSSSNNTWMVSNWNSSSNGGSSCSSSSVSSCDSSSSSSCSSGGDFGGGSSGGGGAGGSW
jgi:uncharacterized protein